MRKHHRRAPTKMTMGSLKWFLQQTNPNHEQFKVKQIGIGLLFKASDSNSLPNVAEDAPNGVECAACSRSCDVVDGTPLTWPLVRALLFAACQRINDNHNDEFSTETVK